MTTPIVKITVPQKGLSKGDRSVKIDAEGFQGTACMSATEPFRKLFQEQKMEEKPELYEEEQRHEHLSE